MRFLDTNIVLRYLTRDDEQKAEAVYQLLQRVKAGQEELTTTEAIIAEIVYVLSSPRLYHLEPAEIGARVTPILKLRGLKLAHKQTYIRAFDLYATYPFLDFEDAVALAQMERLGISEIVSYDEDFNRVPAVRRTEP